MSSTFSDIFPVSDVYFPLLC